MSDADFTFYPGIPEPSWAHRFETGFISIARLRRRKSDFVPPKQEWGMDCAGFMEVFLKGEYQSAPEEFAVEASGWANRIPGCTFVASQDYMCEEVVLAKTGGTVESHQRKTIERYDRIKAAWRSEADLMPVLQGFQLREYLRHIDAYGYRLSEGMKVGVGSVCKRNRNITEIEDILGAIHDRRPDLELHGFGLKTTALKSPFVRARLRRADSMAGAFHARRQANVLLTALRKDLGQHIKPKEARAIYAARGVKMPDPNDWQETMAFANKVAAACLEGEAKQDDQMNLWGWAL